MFYTVIAELPFFSYSGSNKLKLISELEEDNMDNTMIGTPDETPSELKIKNKNGKKDGMSKSKCSC